MVRSAVIASSSLAILRSNHARSTSARNVEGTALRAGAHCGTVHINSSVTFRRAGVRSARRGACRSRTHTATWYVSQYWWPVLGRPSAQSDSPSDPEGHAASFTVGAERSGHFCATQFVADSTVAHGADAGATQGPGPTHASKSKTRQIH